MVNNLLITKATAFILSDERLRKGIGWTIVAILSPFILVIVLLCGILSGTAEHNSTALELSFNDVVISENVPEEYRGHIEDMRSSFKLLDKTIETLKNQMEDGNSLDLVRVKAIFYSLYFGADRPSLIDHIKFVDSFTTYEKRSRTIKNEDRSTTEEIYTVLVPIKELSIVYENIAKTMGKTATYEDMANATEIYYRILYGGPAPTYGQEFDDFTNRLPVSDKPFTSKDEVCSPIGENWRSVVTSEFGYRKDPFTGQKKIHGGIDLGMPKGTPIRSAIGGTVMLVRYSTTGYGYHIMVDHGGGFVTLYAHCSKILVTEGQKVIGGQQIGNVGSTGKSTGNHLHFEIRINGKKQNPRSYLP